MFLDVADENLIEFIHLLQKNEVRYMLIGGMAVNFYGINRTTQDMDLWLAPTLLNRDKFAQALVDVGYTTEELDDLITSDFEIPQVFTIWVGKEPLDCLTVVHYSIDFDEAEKTMVKMKLNEQTNLQIVSLDYLREMKIRSHRQKDWQDVSLLDKLMTKNKEKK